MDAKIFWDLIESSGGDGKRLATLLQENKPEDIRGFGDIIDLLFNKAYNWNLWAAAYLINGGCSEEEFDQFIYWLISLGEENYTNALENPDVLSDIVQDDDSTFKEDIIVAGNLMLPSPRISWNLSTDHVNPEAKNGKMTKNY
jgi:hypothetical protein